MHKKFKFKIIIIFVIVIGLFTISDVKAKDKNNVNIYFFHSNSCSHCQSEQKLLDKLLEDYDNVNLYSYEISNDENKRLMLEVAELYGIEVNGVPLTIIGDAIYTGFSDEKGASTFIKTIEYYSRYGYEDKTGNYLNIDTGSVYSVKDSDISLKEFSSKYNNYKLILNIYSDDLSLSNTSLIIGLLLGLNPFILIFLLLIITKCKKDNLTIMKMGILYIISNIIISSFYSLMDSGYIKVIIPIIILLLYLIFRKKEKINNYMLFIFLASIIDVISSYIYPNYLAIYNNIISLNSVSISFWLISYIEVYFVYFFIPLVIFIMFVSLKERRLNKVIS
jgi:thiol-disulfide isomerase/thioredoxin